ncbi:amidase domain-containing protein [Virgibacillus sp. W0181]|uniref:amidase domain-containing protein n=1 Tax=Virgibacillus sp. W0181 TaxID=3391581 RepID=UPI003F47D982
MGKIQAQWLDFFQKEHLNKNWWVRKKELFHERNAEIVRIRGEGRFVRGIAYDQQKTYEYLLHLSFFIKQNDYFYIEEQTIPYQYQLKDGKLMDHKTVFNNPAQPITTHSGQAQLFVASVRTTDHTEERFSYDRHAAVRYAERWWNDYNPEYRTFSVDCTNYISQCLRAGGAPMRGAPIRDKGWWYNGDNWSYSWAVAHSLRWYLSGSTEGLKGKETDTAINLLPGDIICYDFQGDGRWDHNTIVVANDANGMPLVNAHTDNSRHRYWSYEDSTAWTPEIQYKFFQIGKT